MGGGRGRAKRHRISTLFAGEALFGPLGIRTNKQVSHTHTYTHSCTEQQRLFKLLIKRLAPSSYAVKLAEGVRVQEILAFLTHGLIGKTWLKQHLYDINTIPNGRISML